MTSLCWRVMAAGDHQQRCGELCVSVGAPVAERLEEHHGHRADRDGLRHAGAGPEAHPGSERWVGLRVHSGGAAACDWSVWLQGRPSWLSAPSTLSPAPGSWFPVLRPRRGWRPCTSGCSVRPPQRSCCSCHSNSLVGVCGKVSGCRVGALWS